MRFACNRDCGGSDQIRPKPQLRYQHVNKAGIVPAVSCQSETVRLGLIQIGTIIGPIVSPVPCRPLRVRCVKYRLRLGFYEIAGKWQ
jgi:hypothetical protein